MTGKSRQMHHISISGINNPAPAAKVSVLFLRQSVLPKAIGSGLYFFPKIFATLNVP